MAANGDLGGPRLRRGGRGPGPGALTSFRDLEMEELEEAVLTETRIAERLEGVAEMFRKAAHSDYPSQVGRAFQTIVDALAADHKLLVFGNGGSASDAQHICGELVVRFQAKRRALAAIALCCDGAVLTA